jgi:ABC-2 family transporter
VNATRARTLPRRDQSPRTARLHGVLPAGMWTREWLLTLARPRAVVVKLLMPLLLTVPLVSGRAPTFWAGMLLTVLVAMVGVVGSGVSLSRARSGGLLARLAVVPRPPWRVVGGWLLAAAAVDCVQMLPVAVVAIVGGGGDAGAALALLLCAGAVVLATNVLGCTLSLLAESPGEVLVDAIMVLAPLLFLGGLFTGVPRDGWRWAVAHVDPFAYLHSAFVTALGGSAVFDSGAVVLAAVLTTCVALVALVPLSRALMERG